jgi:sRNA-binding carbon storage regulator CsrA
MEVREGNKVRVGCKFDQSIKIFRAELAQPERKPERPAFDLGGEAGGP